MSESFTGEKFTPIPNSYLEGKARLLLSGNEHKILSVIERETFGFHRERAKVSPKYLLEKTGLLKQNVHRALVGLRKKGVIGIETEGAQTVIGIAYPVSRNDYSGNQIRLPEISESITPVSRNDYPEVSKAITPVIGIENGEGSGAYSPKPCGTAKETFKEREKETPKETPYRLLGSVPPKEDGNPQAASLSPPKAKRESEVYALEFSEFWEAYPRKEEKAGAFRCYQGLVKRGNRPDELLRAARNYAQSCRTRGTEPRYIKLPATFLGRDKPFLEWVNPSPQPKLNLTREVSDFSNAPDGYWQGGVFVPFEDD